ncbi:hypothetical protein GF378_02320, partial [Candidatus Pacearchaeota archaeon]|nr:hypothetical protein [Candidatus Pacearchaeota archaeon]
ENLTCYAKASDSEGNALDYSGAWYKDGTFSHNITGWNEAKQSLKVWTINKTVGGSDEEYGEDIAMDSEGNIIITGRTNSYGAGGTDFWTVKFDSHGNYIWGESIGGTSNDYAEGLAIDSNDNIIAAGTTNSFGSSEDFFIVKYNKYGKQIWNETIGGSGEERCYDVATDSDDNIIITGKTNSFGVGVNDNLWIIKYDSSGNQIWNETFGGEDYERGEGIDVDSNNNIIVTGFTTSFGGGGFYVWTVKCDSSGNQIWNKTLGGSGSSSAYDVAVDSNDDIIVGGYNHFSSSYDSWIIKYSSGGSYLWNETLGGSNTDRWYGVAVDSNDNIFAVGESSSFSTAPNVWTAKYDSEGGYLWNKTVGKNNYASQGKGIIVDNEDNPIITGYWSYLSVDDVWLLKYETQFGYEPDEFVSSTLDSSYTSSNDKWSCKVKATDNSIPENEITYNTSSNITILSTPPYFDPDLENQTVAENSQLYYDINCSDADEGETLQYYINDSSKFSIYPGTGLIDWTPNYNDAGVYSYNVTCGDGQTNVSQIFLINVTNTNRLPAVSNLTLNATSANNYASDNLTLYIGNASDEDGESVKNITTWRKSNSPITVLQMPFEGGSLNGNSTGVLDATQDFTGNADVVNATNVAWNSSIGYDGFGAYEFNGADTLINVGTGNNNAFALDEFTLFARVYISNSVNNQIVFSKRASSSSDYDYGLMADAAYNEFRLWISNSTTTYTNANVPNASIAGAYNQWYDVAGTYNGSIAKLYVNGDLKDSSTAVTGNLNKSGKDLIIGSYKKGTEHFNGTIDEVSIYDYALSPEQIKALHNNRTDLIVSNETSVGESWKACVTPNDGLDNGLEVCSDPLVIGAVCGNGLVEFGEDCDGTNLSDETCTTQGYDSGTLSCTAACVFNTSECVSEDGDGNGGGGGGGGGASYDTTTLSDIEFTIGFEGTYEEDDVIKFTYNNQDHTITIEDVDDDQVRITITSTPITLVLVPGIIQRVDLDGNGFDDLLLNLKEINYLGDITLLVKEIPLEAPEQEYPEEGFEPAPSPAPEPEPTPTPEPEEKGFFEQLIDNTILLIVLASMILILAIGVPTAMHFRKKKRKIKKGKEWYYDGKSKGYTPTTIYNSLLKRGWKHDEISNVMQSDINDVDEKVRQVKKEQKKKKKPEEKPKANKNKKSGKKVDKQKKKSKKSKK